MKSGDQFGNYVVLDVLGAGAAATVWRVRHALLQSNHALKVLSVESASLRGRLVQEGRIQAELVSSLRRRRSQRSSAVLCPCAFVWISAPEGPVTVAVWTPPTAGAFDRAGR